MLVCPELRKEMKKKVFFSLPMALAYDLKTRTARAKRLASALTGPPRRAGTTRRGGGDAEERRCGAEDSSVPVEE